MAESVLAVTALTAALTGATVSGVQLHEQKMAEKDAAHEANVAKQEQEAADKQAETERLQALKLNQEKTDYSNVWGVDSALSKESASAVDDNNKRQAQAQTMMKQEEEENPFYTKGLI